MKPVSDANREHHTCILKSYSLTSDVILFGVVIEEEESPN